MYILSTNTCVLIFKRKEIKQFLNLLMNDPTGQWNEKRFNYIINETHLYLNVKCFFFYNNYILWVNGV